MAVRLLLDHDPIPCLLRLRIVIAATPRVAVIVLAGVRGEVIVFLNALLGRGCLLVLVSKEVVAALVDDVEGILGIRHVEAMCAWAPGAREAGEMVACVVW